MNKRGNCFLDNSKSKKGQVTVFIILGIIIVGVAALVYFLYPQIKSTLGIITDPESYIQTCMQNEIQQTITNLSLQGGVINPTNSILYYNEKLGHSYNVEYLCYTNQYYLPCIMQQPLLQQSIESEINKNIQQTANTCFNNLQSSYKGRGYSVSFTSGNTTVELLPEQVRVVFNNQLTLTKGNAQRYENFSVVVNNNLYELSAIANSILNWEVTYGDSPVQVYMSNYHNLIIEKKQQSDGTKVYILTDLNTGGIFQFATRGYAMPPGY